jgi:Rad3-related DNA helicase
MPNNSKPFPFKKFDNPESIKRYCQGQKDIVKRIEESNKKYIILNAPTGVGKSLIAMMSGNRMSYTTNYVCTTKVLQNQLKDDFNEAYVMKGRGNYKCNKFWTDDNNITAGDCASKCTDVKDGKISCDYEVAKSEMFRSRYRVLNTAYWLAEANYVGKLSKQKFVVIDEADRLDAEAINFIGLVLTKFDIQKYGLTAPVRITKWEAWRKWGFDTLAIMNKKYPGMIRDNERDKGVIKAYRFKGKVSMFNNVVDESWVFDKTKYGSWIFKPTWINKELGQQYIWRHSDKFVMMSATPPMPKSLGLMDSEVDVIDVESSYPVENRWVYYNGVVDMSWNKDRHEDVGKHVYDILNKHWEHKGIIHTCSYAMRDMIIKCLPTYKERFITHGPKDKEEKMKEFLTDKGNKVFLSPSSERGVSLDGDKGRFCIWLKVPFGNLGDKQIAARTYSRPFGQEWYLRDAMQTIVQGCGRVVRGYDDWGYSYILDKQFSKIKQYCPEWFMKGLVVGSGL